MKLFRSLRRVEKGQSPLAVIVFTVLACVLILAVVPSIFNILRTVSTGGYSLSDAIDQLRSDGYVVAAPGDDITAGSIIVDDLTLDGKEIDLSSPQTGQIIYFNGTKWLALGVGTNGYILTTQGVGQPPIWSEDEVGDTFPSGTRGDILIYGAAGWQVLHTGSSGQYLKAGGAGADPSWDTLPTELPGSPEQGDIIYYNGAAWVSLAHGTAGQVLETGGHAANPSWATIPTEFPAAPEQGDIVYWNGAAWVSLAHGTAGQVLESGGHGANPSWGTDDTTAAYAPICVAATDATAAEKAIAIASGGAVCDGVNDQVELEAADTAAAGGLVYLFGGNFTLTSWTINSKVIGEGCGARAVDVTVLNVSTGLTVNNPGYLGNVKIKTPHEFAGTALTFDESAGSPYWIGARLYDNIWLEGYASHYTGTGVAFTTTSTAGHEAAIAFCSGGYCMVQNYEYGMTFLATEVTSDSFINGNTFEFTDFEWVKYPLTFTRTSNGECSDNYFVNLEVQPDASTVDGITINTGNVNNGGRVYFWDWALATGQKIKSGTVQHRFIGLYTNGSAQQIVDSIITDEFSSGGTTTGIVGSLGWTTNGVTAPDPPDYVNNHPGHVRIYTNNSDNNVNYFVLGSVTSDAVAPDGYWEATYIVYIDSVADVCYFFGVMNDFSAAPGNQDRAGFEFDTDAADANWMMVLGDGSNSTRTSSGVAASTGWHRFSICAGSPAGSLHFQYFIDGTLVGTLEHGTAYEPDTDMAVGAQVTTRTTGAKSFSFDFFMLKQESLAR